MEQFLKAQAKSRAETEIPAIISEKQHKIKIKVRVNKRNNTTSLKVR